MLKFIFGKQYRIQNIDNIPLPETFLYNQYFRLNILFVLMKL